MYFKYNSSFSELAGYKNEGNLPVALDEFISKEASDTFLYSELRNTNPYATSAKMALETVNMHLSDVDFFCSENKSFTG